MKFINLAFLFLIASCTDKVSKGNNQTMDFGLFTLETPTSWTNLKARGADSYVGRIAIDNKDTLDFDLGWYSNTLSEDEPQIIERSSLKYMHNPDTADFIIVENRKGIDPDKYKFNNVSWDTIDGRKSKIVYPRRTGIGITGIYIDSLWQRGAGIDKFNLYGENLKPTNEKAFLKAIRTLKFHKSD